MIKKSNINSNGKKRISTTDKIKKAKKVCFNESKNEIFNFSFLPIEKQYKSSKERKRCLWYSSNELNKMKEDAMNCCYLMRHFGLSRLNYITLAVDPYFRGLEHHCCRERSRRKRNAIAYVLFYQKKLCHDKLAILSCHCNKWASEVAQIDADKDHKESTQVI